MKLWKKLGNSNLKFLNFLQKIPPVYFSDKDASNILVTPQFFKNVKLSLNLKFMVTFWKESLEPITLKIHEFDTYAYKTSSKWAVLAVKFQWDLVDILSLNLSFTHTHTHSWVLFRNTLKRRIAPFLVKYWVTWFFPNLSY